MTQEQFWAAPFLPGKTCGPEIHTQQIPFGSILLTYSAPMVSLLGPAPTGTETIALDPTFESFTLLNRVSH
jgi:hypothetical protein